MMIEWSPQLVVLLVGMALASYTDLKNGKIPNALTGTMIALGLGIGILEGAGLTSAIGLGVAFGIHFPLWMLRVEKGGDAKLLMGLGALMGWELVVETTFWCAILYLPVGLALLTIQGKLINLVSQLLWITAKARGLDPGEAPTPTMLRTAPVIAVATVLALVTSWLDFSG